MTDEPAFHHHDHGHAMNAMGDTLIGAAIASVMVLVVPFTTDNPTKHEKNNEKSVGNTLIQRWNDRNSSIRLLFFTPSFLGWVDIVLSFVPAFFVILRSTLSLQRRKAMSRSSTWRGHCFGDGRQASYSAMWLPPWESVDGRPYGTQQFASAMGLLEMPECWSPISTTSATTPMRLETLQWPF
ncbi:MAG: hypothetical protein JWQ98_1066 [Chlorobi bacterium]|nr:hypothetical protein [Chlorobiota bacterium]